MALLTQAQILAADRRKTRDITVPEWGGEVRLQEMSGDERDAWEAETFRQDPQGQTQLNSLQVRSRLLLRCLIGGDGRRLFADDEIARLGCLSASSLQKLYTEALALNQLRSEDLEGLEGNSGAGPNAGGSSTSANASA